MRLLFDTNFLIEIDRNNRRYLKLLQHLSSKNFDLNISIISVTEFLLGPNLTNSSKSFKLVNELLSNFNWIVYEGEIAKEGAKLLAYNLKNGNPVGFEDTIILATFNTYRFDYLITLNKKHFHHEKVITPEELFVILNKH